MKQFVFVISCISFFVSVSFVTHLIAQQKNETFVIEKKSTKNKTSGHLKEELAVQLEELAHLITRQVQLLAQAQEKLLCRMRELVDGNPKGSFSGATHKALQAQVAEAELKINEAQETISDLIKLNNFLQGT